jgi:acetolactate synthase-1/2/3 large subunit
MSEQAPVSTDDVEETTDERPVASGAESVIRALEQAGVEYVFGVQGGAIMPVYDALYDSEAVTHVTMAHEQGAAHAADAYGVVSGEPGICMATSGPVSATTGSESMLESASPVTRFVAPGPEVAMQMPGSPLTMP